MILQIRDIEQNSFKISVRLSDTILDVKAKIKSKIEIIDIEDQKLVYSGNILTDHRTVEECDIDKNDYVTLIYPLGRKKEVGEMIEKIRNKLDGTFMSHRDDGSSIEASSRETTTEDMIFDDQTTINTSFDSETDELSCSALLEAIPDVKHLRNIIKNDPVMLPKYLSKLSHQWPLVFGKILDNQHAFIDILNTDEYESVDNNIETVETKEHGAIDRLVKKGYGKEMAKKVYLACNCDESGAAELLNYLC